MRSAVSVILSNTAPEPSMSYPDYQQIPHDHQALLVVVRHIGKQLRTKQFNKAFERISKINQLKLNDSQNQPRTVWIRFVRMYPVENNDWGDFQTHRKALGLISIGQCNSQEELNELCRLHEASKVQYAFTLFDSRCILYGLNPDGTIYEGQHSSDVSPCVETPDSSFQSIRDASLRDSGTGMDSHPVELQGAATSLVMPRKNPSSESMQNYLVSQESEANDDDSSSEESTSKSESISTPITYSNMSDSTKEDDGGSPVNSLHPSETDSGKVSHTSDGTGKTSLVTPSNFKARTLFYPTMEESQSLETDIEEFISALFWILESKRLDKLGLRKADRFMLVSGLCAPFEKKDFVGLDLESKNNKRRADGRLKKQLGDLSLQAGLASEAIIHYQAAAEILKSVNDWLWLAGALEGMCSASVAILYPQMRKSQALHRNSSLQTADFARSKAPSSTGSNSLPHGVEPPELSPQPKALKNCLTSLEILEKYREAVTHYTKYRLAGIIETEACIKAALVLIEQKQILAAADFLQNAVFISLQLTENEKMQRFNALSELYMKLGFRRKAAFFKRVAAMRCVSPHNPQPNWGVCHSLLLQLLDGYNLSLDSSDRGKFGFFGWPRLQIQVMHELVGTAKRRGNGPLATRHMTLLVHTMLPHMAADERRDFALQLEALSKENEGIPVAMAIENGLIVPPVHLSHIPSVKVFKLIPPTPHLRPEKAKSKSKEESSPFVYTPFLTNRDKHVKDASKADFYWIEGELCEVNVLLENPLPIELKVSSMCLITEGINFQVNSNVISIPADASLFPATLTGIPLQPGNLRITGYSTFCLGVKSNIRLKNMRAINIPHIDVEIVPALPTLEVETSKPKSEFFSTFSDSIVTSASVSLLMGESQECTITLKNTGKVPIESLELKLDTRSDKKAAEIFKWSEDNVVSQLPIQPGTSASFTIYLFGIGDFIGQPDFHSGDTASVSSLPIANSSLDGPTSLPSRLGAISDRLRSKRTDSAASNKSSSVRSGSSVGSGMYSIQASKPAASSSIKTYEAVLKLKYSGGPGLKTGHHRNCGIALYVEIAPSLYITKWDTLPGDSPSQFYLVLDLWNATQQEMEVHYAKTKQILVEKAESCRIPVPLDRCPVGALTKGKEETACCNHIVTNVDLEWVLPELSGKATLQGIRLTPAMVQFVTVSPIQWEITINGESVKADEMRFEAGEMINVDIWIKNHLQEELQDVKLSLDCFQDYQNGRCNYRLESSLSVIGNDSVFIPKIAPGSCFQHSLSLMFFVSGMYKIDFRCNKKDPSDTAAKYDTPVFPSETVWKYNSPIELQIY